MSDLVAIAYSDLETAKRVADNATTLQKGHDITLDDLIVVERKDNGKVKLHQPSMTGAGAATGALWGGLIGLIFFVPLFGMAIGAASGAAGGAMSDYGVDDNFMKELGENLTPGAAAVVLLIRDMTEDKILPEIKEQGTIIRTSLDDEAEGRLGEALAAAGH
jgi:uncharacterized membrane protein